MIAAVLELSKGHAQQKRVCSHVQDGSIKRRVAAELERKEHTLQPHSQLYRHLCTQHGNQDNPGMCTNCFAFECDSEAKQLSTASLHGKQAASIAEQLYV